MAIDDPTKNCTFFFQLHLEINKCQLVGTDLEFIICPQHTRYPTDKLILYIYIYIYYIFTQNIKRKIVNKQKKEKLS